jgi:hypothetical protein
MIDNLFQWFWAAMIFGSIAWYALLLFYVGIKGGFEIVRMATALKGRAPEELEQ